MPYVTKQRQAILRALERQGEHPAAAPELAETLRREGRTVGLATIYRQLDRLEETGLVHKVVTEAGSLYQYCPRQAAGEVCFLLRCRGCGRLEHLDCSRFRELHRHLSEAHGFQVDPRGTVLTGLCGLCAKQEAACGKV